MSFDELRTYRYNMHKMFSDVAQEHAKAYDEWDKKFAECQLLPVANEEHEIPEVNRLWNVYYEQRERSAAIAVTFAGMAIEALLYDYAAQRLTDNFVKDNLDKLDVKQKFLIYPLLICQKQPDKGGKAYASLHELVKLRNRLVHFKSVPFKLEELQTKANDFHDDWNERLRQGVKNAIDCMDLVVQELIGLHGKDVPLCLRMMVEPPQQLQA